MHNGHLWYSGKESFDLGLLPESAINEQPALHQPTQKMTSCHRSHHHSQQDDIISSFTSSQSTNAAFDKEFQCSHAYQMALESASLRLL